MKISLIRLAVLTATALLLLPPILAAEEPAPVWFVQLTDPHIDIDDSTPERRLQLAVEVLNEIVDPAFVIVTGDLADHGSAWELRRYADIVNRCEAPVHNVLGNHDHRGLRVFEGELGGKTQFTFSHDGIFFAVINSTHANGRAEMFEDGLDWLQAELDRARSEGYPHLFVANHHPPVLEEGDTQIDGGLDSLLRIVDENDVTMFLSGHVHRNFIRLANGTVFVVTAPAKSRDVHFRVVCIDRGELSTGTFSARTLWDTGFPTVMITYPADPENAPQPKALENAEPIRCLTFSNASVSRVEYSIERRKSGPGIPEYVSVYEEVANGNLSAVSTHVWQDIPEVRAVEGGSYTLTVTAYSQGGHTASDSIRLMVVPEYGEVLPSILVLGFVFGYIWRRRPLGS